MSERTSRRRKRRTQLVSPAARWFLTGELQRDMNIFEVLNYDLPVTERAHEAIRALLQAHSDMVPEGRLKRLQDLASGKRRKDRRTILDDDVEAFWKAHGFEWPDDGVGILERRMEVLAVVDGAPVRRGTTSSGWVDGWLDQHREPTRRRNS